MDRLLLKSINPNLLSAAGRYAGPRMSAGLCGCALHRLLSPPDQILQAVSRPRLWPWKPALPLVMDLNDGLYHILSSPFTVMLRQTSSFLLHSTERDCQNRKGIFLSLQFLTCTGCMVRDEPERQILTIHPQPLRESIHLFLVHATSVPAPAFQCLKHCKILPWGHQFLILVFYRM